MSANPFFTQESRPPIEGDNFTREEVGLAFHNSAMPLEGLRYDVTPTGMHYLLSHFDIPAGDASTWQLQLAGLVSRPTALSLAQIQALPAVTHTVTLECAGNGRAGMSPRYPSMPWQLEAVGTSQWTGTPLHNLLALAGIKAGVTEIAFLGADRGFDRGDEHDYGRSLSLTDALRDEVLVVYAMNGQPLLPQHGAPLRLIVPGWYGMASVKWLNRIVALDRPFDGFQQAVGYHYRKKAGEPGEPVRHMRVKSLLLPPGIPDWYTRRRLVEPGRIEITGRAWSGRGVPIAKVELGIDAGQGFSWHSAETRAGQGSWAWSSWKATWDAALHAPGSEIILACRATDIEGHVQPLEPDWNTSGMGNNAVQRVSVTIRKSA